MPNPTTLTAWNELGHHLTNDMNGFSLRTAMPSLSVQFEKALFDFSKHLATPQTMALLIKLARESGVEAQRDKMFAGEKINNTEGRAVLHIACRADENADIRVDGENVVPFVHDVLDRMGKFSNALRNKSHLGHTGKPITDVVNIGIGGSDLGPRFVVDALQDYCDGPTVHFVSNVDGQDIAQTLKKLNPETTLFIVASKTFTTQETMMNAAVAKDWLLQSAPEFAVAHHFAALSTNLEAVKAFGISEENMFPFREWVGGRYSLWSAIGLSIDIAIGHKRFTELLSGARAMDQHFKTAPLEQNIPVLMGMLGVWYRNFYDYGTHALLPYDNRLAKLAKFTQQMDMESNGKAVDRDGKPVNYATGPVIFGEPGTDSQHSFMQLVHQSPSPIPADFILCKKPAHSLDQNHKALCANFMAQTRALAIGQTLDEAGGDASRVFTGNRPTTSIILPELTPFYLGLLIAAYEHKVFVQGAVWNLNSYDQPGVELGKKLATPILGWLNGGAAPSATDSSTDRLYKFLMG